MKKIHREGIRDWAAKKCLLQAIYNVTNNKALVQALAGDLAKRDEEPATVIQQCYDAYLRWGTGKPKSERSLEFWKMIIDDLNLDVGVNQLWSSSIVGFVDFFEDRVAVTTNNGQVCIEAAIGELINDPNALLDDETKVQLRSRMTRRARLTANAEDSSGEYDLRVHEATNFEGTQTGIQKGQIGVHQFYNSPEAAAAWAALVDAKNYRMYLDCLLSLKQLLKSAHWKKIVGSGKYNVAVTLGGGGSPEKDGVLAANLAMALNDPNVALEYVIVDISPYMIHQSIKNLRRRINTVDTNSAPQITRKVRDFRDLDVAFRADGWQSVVWAILGGTVGNVNERMFFQSINSPSRAGDVLIIGIDTLDSESATEFEGRMNSQYRGTELDALLLSPIRAALFSESGDEPIVRVELPAEQHQHRYSSVPNSRTAIFRSPPFGGTDDGIELAHSTRYAVEDFITFARTFGWEHLATATASQESTFQQLLLRRVR